MKNNTFFPSVSFLFTILSHAQLIMRSAHLRLAELYRILNDDQNDSLQVRLAACLAEEMELICGVCQERYGDQGGNSLEALPCSHIFHSK